MHPTSGHKAYIEVPKEPAQFIIQRRKALPEVDHEAFFLPDNHEEVQQNISEAALRKMHKVMQIKSSCTIFNRSKHSVGH